MGFKDDLNQDMLSNHFNTDEFGEVITYTPASGDPAVQIQAIYDEPALSEQFGASVSGISHQPRLFVRLIDLPSGSPDRGDTVEISQNEWHKAKTLRVVDTANEQLGHTEILLQEIST